MRLVDRYILAQLAVPFLIGLFTFAVIMLGDFARQLGAALLGARVSPLLIAKFLAYNAPHCLSWSMPGGTVVGVAMAVTLLANHGEITAMRAGGASVPRICGPILVAGLAASLLSFVIGEYVAPPAARRARDTFYAIGYSQPVVREEHDQFFRDTEGRIFYVRHMNADTNELEDVVIWEESGGRLVSITAARWAEVQGDLWFLRQGSTVRLDKYGDQTGPVERFARREIKLWRALQEYYASKETPFEMSASELGDMIATVGPAGRSTYRYEVEWHFKYSIPLACLVFALIAAPISFRFARYGSFVGVVIAILIVFLYNGVRSWTLAFGLAGTLDPFLAGWIPDILFGALGLALLAATR